MILFDLTSHPGYRSNVLAQPGIILVRKKKKEKERKKEGITRYSGTPLIRPPTGHKNLVVLTG